MEPALNRFIYHTITFTDLDLSQVFEFEVAADDIFTEIVNQIALK